MSAYIFFFIGDTIFLTNGRQTKIMKLEKYKHRAIGCAAFHPTDDNVVFIFGGKTNNNKDPITSVFKYQINNESHHHLRPLDEMHLKHSCMGYVTKTGRSVSKAGLPQPIFCRQGRHSGVHNSGLSTLSILQNPGKD